MSRFPVGIQGDRKGVVVGEEIASVFSDPIALEWRVVDGCFADDGRGGACHECDVSGPFLSVAQAED